MSCCVLHAHQLKGEAELHCMEFSGLVPTGPFPRIQADTPPYKCVLSVPNHYFTPETLSHGSGSGEGALCDPWHAPLHLERSQCGSRGLGAIPRMQRLEMLGVGRLLAAEYSKPDAQSRVPDPAPQLLPGTLTA